jgi:phage FluMu gp28-like protein
MTLIKGYKPHEKQRLIHNSINKDKYKYYILNIGRQFGKSILGINQMLYWSINDKGSNIAWVTPIYKQGKKVFKEFRKYTEKSGIFSYNESDLVINGLGSNIQFFSGERPDNIRGNTFDYLICDEFAFTRSQLWDEVLSATVLVKGKKVLFISTPNGKNHFYKMSLQPNYDNRYKYFHYTSYDSPFIDHNDLEERKRSLPQHVFKQEYLAEFIDDATGLFKNVTSCISSPGAATRLFAGLDIGRADDYTVLTIVNDLNQMVYAERWRHDEWGNIINKVADKINNYKAKTYVEVNNQGDVFFEMLRAKVSNNLIEPYITSSKTKPIMIEDLAVLFEQKDITILNYEWLIDELQAFTYVYNPQKRSVQYSAPQGVHDDSVISLALAIQARKELGRYGSYTVGRI